MSSGKHFGIRISLAFCTKLGAITSPGSKRLQCYHSSFSWPSEYTAVAGDLWGPFQFWNDVILFVCFLIIWLELRRWAHRELDGLVHTQQWGGCTLNPGPVPGQWWEGECTLTCNETRCQTHRHGQAEYPSVEEHLEAEPGNDKAKMVVFRCHAAEVMGTKNTACMSSDPVTKGHQGNKCPLPGGIFPCHFPAKPCRHGGGAFQEPLWLTLILRPLDNELDQELERPSSSPSSVTSCVAWKSHLPSQSPEFPH